MENRIEELLALGRIGLETGYYEQARGYFEKVLALDASNQEAIDGLARIDEILSRKTATAAEPVQGEPVEPPHRVVRKRRVPEKETKEQERSPVQWFKRQSRLGKIAILAGVPLLFLLYAGLADMISPTQEATPTLAPNVYHVVNVDDISLAIAVRFRVEVTTEFPIAAGQISDLCEQVVEDLKSQRPLNAIVVFLYDTRSLLSGGYSIARCVYAPNGVWSYALNVQTGDYSTHKFTYEYQPKVNDPQAALLDRPTEQEYNLCQQWDKLADELLSALPLESTGDDMEATETIAFERIAERNGVSVQIVEDAVLKCIFWAWR